MDDNIAFSFVMPAYKKQFLHEAVDSILKQTYQEFEVIIVNDKSPENLDEVIQSFHDNRIRYATNQVNIGGQNLVANWNHCIKYAQHDYIILATDDDMFEPNFLEEAIKLIKKYPKVDVIRSGVKKIDEKGKVLDIEFPLKEYMTSREFTLQYAKGGIISCVSNYIYKKGALNKNGGFISFPRAHFSDDATALSIAKNGIACIPNNLLRFRVSTINLSNCSDLTIVMDQIKATEQFMGWYLNLVNTLDTVSNDFFETACYGGIKTKYIIMIEKLTDKIPISRFFMFLRTIKSTQNLFGRERLRITANYIINKIS